MFELLASLGTAAVAAGLAWLVVTRPNGAKRPPGARQLVHGLDVGPVAYWGTSLAVGFVAFLVALAFTGLPLVAGVPAIVVSTLPRAHYQRKRSRRLAEVQEAWPDGLRDLVSSVRSGASLHTALENLASFGPAPLRRAFNGFDVYARSMGLEAALEMIKSDLADPTSDRVIEVLILANRSGGVVVPKILSDLADATTRDLWTLEQVQSEALEQKINSRIVFVLPWLVLVVITSRSGAFREFYATTSGLLVVALGGLLSLVGIAVASRFGAQPDEPRVFGGVR